MQKINGLFITYLFNILNNNNKKEWMKIIEIPEILANIRMTVHGKHFEPTNVFVSWTIFGAIGHVGIL